MCLPSRGPPTRARLLPLSLATSRNRDSLLGWRRRLPLNPQHPSPAGTSLFHSGWHRAPLSIPVKRRCLLLPVRRTARVSTGGGRARCRLPRQPRLPRSPSPTSADPSLEAGHHRLGRQRRREPKRRPWEGSRCGGAGSGCDSDVGPRCGGRRGSRMWRLQLPRGPRRQQRCGSGGTTRSLEMRQQRRMWRRSLSRRRRGLRRALAPGRRPPGRQATGHQGMISDSVNILIVSAIKMRTESVSFLFLKSKC